MEPLGRGQGYILLGEGQLRVIGSSALGGGFPPRQDFKRESNTEGKWDGEERQSGKLGRVLNNEKVVLCREACGRGEGKWGGGARGGKRPKKQDCSGECFFF